MINRYGFKSRIFFTPPCLVIVFLTWVLHFPWTWLFKAVITFEIIVAIIVFIIELGARKILENSGWIMIFAGIFQIYFAVLLILIRLGIWVDQYFKIH
ncbi:hypothetical protein [Acinetobacter silvestris]|uniref:Uncharacterized protein n=1 Tax=Acinetobacter silvestris TaxID=1977882 RepID=A0A1Y3CEI0_9GAMM|nr:hypothetical protein [Acinetobacter silvestris]OTG65509.1 hypothetical protein B9T28_08600 [Acinetobacter silvestris]